MNNFTKGPWGVDDNHGKRYIEPINSNEPVAQVFKQSAGLGLYHANADLIAAAPELYAALRDCISVLEVLGGNGNVYKNAKATLAKARGETK